MLSGSVICLLPMKKWKFFIWLHFLEHRFCGRQGLIAAGIIFSISVTTFDSSAIVQGHSQPFKWWELESISDTCALHCDKSSCTSFFGTLGLHLPCKTLLEFCLNGGPAFQTVKTPRNFWKVYTRADNFWLWYNKAPCSEWVPKHHGWVQVCLHSFPGLTYPSLTPVITIESIWALKKVMIRNAVKQFYVCRSRSWSATTSSWAEAVGWLSYHGLYST